MPEFGKSTLSQFLRTGCMRQLRLEMSPANKRCQAERDAQSMPEPQAPRPGLADIKHLGDEWEHEKLHELVLVFNNDEGKGPVRGDRVFNKPQGRWNFIASDLDGSAMLSACEAGDFLVQPRFEAKQGSFARAIGLGNLHADFGLDVPKVIPDLIMVRPPGEGMVIHTGEQQHMAERRVLPSGDTSAIHPEDKRLRLRVVDIKLTCEANSGYFAEVAYYNMALAGWLEDCRVHPEQRIRDLPDRFIVVAECAVWPGSHETSKLTRLMQIANREGMRRPDNAAALQAINDELEAGPFEVFAQRIRRIIRVDLPAALGSRWQDLPWHVDSRCRGCDYLGATWRETNGDTGCDAGYCVPQAAATRHLSMVAFLPRGASQALERHDIHTVEQLAALAPDDAVFDGHQSLRTARTLVTRRAAVLAGTAEAGVVPDAGLAYMMPRHAHLRINVMASSDPGSRLTFAFGLSASWRPATPFGVEIEPGDLRSKRWEPATYVVDFRDPRSEKREFLAFLGAIQAIMRDKDIIDSDRRHAARSTYQVYIWNHVTYEHLRRVASRHIEDVLKRFDILRLAWLFPPTDLVADPASVTRDSPVTIVQEVVRRVVAVPVPHTYALLPVARAYHTHDLPERVASFRVHPLFEDALGDQIPPERAHEIWSRSADPNWSRRLVDLDRTVGRHLAALESIVRRLGDDMGERLTGAAPPLPKEGSAHDDHLGVGTNSDSRLWMAFETLNCAVARGEAERIQAMPVHEREARFRSARLEYRLAEEHEQAEIVRLGLEPVEGRRAYRLGTGSTEVSMREGDISWALAPATEDGFLRRSLKRAAADSSDPSIARELGAITLGDATTVSIAAIDRVNRVVVVDANRRRPESLDRIEAARIADLSHDVMLDPVFVDTFAPKLRRVLKQIGNPRVASASPLAARATGGTLAQMDLSVGHVTPVAEILWAAKSLEKDATDRKIPWILSDLRVNGKLPLNDWQREALVLAVLRRVSLLWGPPGTGKSHALVYIIIAFLRMHERSGKRLRILVTAFTWAAIDNLLADLRPEVPRIVGKQVRFARLRSPSGRVPDDATDIDVVLNSNNPGDAVTNLRMDLVTRSGPAASALTIVGTTAHQVHNLVRMGTVDRAMDELFDLVIIDEGSQMDVAKAIVALSAMARGAAVVCAGDPLQLPPIHMAEAPQGLDMMVGSIYEFLANIHGVKQTALERNYRSSGEIVGFFRRAGYPEGLHANSPKLRARFKDQVPDFRPEGWPKTLAWTPEWRDILDPGQPLTCLIHPDSRSSQWNEFEAQMIAAMTWLLYRHLLKGLDHEIDYDEKPKEVGNDRHTPQSFWQKAIGIVTPHRAQQGLVIRALEAIFPESEGHSRAWIRGAVDTVERFQGQERDVILATFALGDPDMVAAEDEFLLDLRRFNVLVSRPRAKLVVMMSEQVLDHLPRDVEVLRDSRLIKEFAESACTKRRMVNIPWIVDGTVEKVEVSHRWQPVTENIEIEPPPPPPPPKPPEAGATVGKGAFNNVADEIIGHITGR